jgi:hypothetical protein
MLVRGQAQDEALSYMAIDLLQDFLKSPEVSHAQMAIYPEHLHYQARAYKQ